MRLTSILGNSQKLDGGAMFGNAPKGLWSRWIEPDEKNRIPLACRCLLIEELDGGAVKRRILLEAGIGNFFEPKLKNRYGVVEDDHALLLNLEAAGVSPEQIDVVVLSHLHFDHAGGLLSSFKEGEDFSLVFSNAHYVVGHEAWERAQNPHFRDRASFIPQLSQLLEETKRLELVRGDDSTTLGESYRFHQSEGHTPGLLLTEIETSSGPLVFAADLIPGVPWVHLPITMGYDRYPEKLIEEKEALLTSLVEREGALFFTHDSEVALGQIIKDERGRFSVGNTLKSVNGASSELW